MATNSRVSPRRFKHVPSSPANAPCRTLTLRPAQAALDCQWGVRGDQLAKLPRSKTSCSGRSTVKHSGNPVGRQASASVPLRSRRGRYIRQTAASARFSSAPGTFVFPHQRQVERDAVLEQFPGQRLSCRALVYKANQRRSAGSAGDSSNSVFGIQTGFFLKGVGIETSPLLL